MTVTNIIDRARSQLDENLDEIDHVETDADVVGTFSTEFSTEFLIEQLNRAIREVARYVKASHLPELIQSTSYPGHSGKLLKGARLLRHRVYASGVRCEETSPRTLRRRLRSRRKPTSEFPIYTVENDIISVYPDDIMSFEAHYVLPPAPYTLWDYNNETELPLDVRFRAALSAYVAAQCILSKPEREGADLHLKLFQDEIDAYTVGASHTQFRDVEVAIE